MYVSRTYMETKKLKYVLVWVLQIKTFFKSSNLTWVWKKFYIAAFNIIKMLLSKKEREVVQSQI